VLILFDNSLASDLNTDLVRRNIHLNPSFPPYSIILEIEESSVTFTAEGVARRWSCDIHLNNKGNTDDCFLLRDFCRKEDKNNSPEIIFFDD
jgi:hypothetical protein